MDLGFGQFAVEMKRTTPLYAGFAAAIADDTDVANLLLAQPAVDQRIPVLLFAAIHDLVLRQPDLPLAAWYGSITPEPRTDDGYSTLRDTVLAHRDELEVTVASRVVQTNEVGRAAFVLPALALVDHEVGPITLVDVGTSAGLMLQLDRFSYRYDNWQLDPADGRSMVTITARSDGTVPPTESMPKITERFGVDRHPIDVTDPDDARWLQACLWPDRIDRFGRLTAAIDIAQTHPSTIVKRDATDHIGELLATTAGHPVVLNSWVLNYFTSEQRSAYLAALDHFGSTCDLTWVFAESPRVTPELPHPANDRPELTHLNIARWRSGVRTVDHLALCHPHGSRVTWRASER